MSRFVAGHEFVNFLDKARSKHMEIILHHPKDRRDMNQEKAFTDYATHSALAIAGKTHMQVSR
jgi:capsule polysaccharide modification protein KpsS